MAVARLSTHLAAVATAPSSSSQRPGGPPFPKSRYFLRPAAFHPDALPLTAAARIRPRDHGPSPVRTGLAPPQARPPCLSTAAGPQPLRHVATAGAA